MKRYKVTLMMLGEIFTFPTKALTKKQASDKALKAWGDVMMFNNPDAPPPVILNVAKVKR